MKTTLQVLTNISKYNLLINVFTSEKVFQFLIQLVQITIKSNKEEAEYTKYTNCGGEKGN